MHERLVYGLTPFPAVLILTSYLSLSRLSPMVSKVSQAAGAWRAACSGRSVRPLPALAHALTVSIKAQQPGDKLAVSL